MKLVHQINSEQKWNKNSVTVWVTPAIWSNHWLRIDTLYHCKQEATDFLVVDWGKGRGQRLCLALSLSVQNSQCIRMAFPKAAPDLEANPTSPEGLKPSCQLPQQTHSIFLCTLKFMNHSFVCPRNSSETGMRRSHTSWLLIQAL